LTKDSTVGEPRAVIVAREPGLSLAYSGGGYTVLQLLIEEVTHQPFPVYMKESVLQPLGMTKSSFDLDAIASEGRIQDLAPSFEWRSKTSSGSPLYGQGCGFTLRNAS
jgi:CubicO group peptidase (beta-lactamase class C family)